MPFRTQHSKNTLGKRMQNVYKMIPYFARKEPVNGSECNCIWMTYAWPAHTHTRSRAWGECRCVGGVAEERHMSIVNVPVAVTARSPPDHRTTRQPAVLQASPLFSPAQCAQLHPVPTLYSQPPSWNTLDNKQRTAHWNFCFCHCRWFLRLLRRSSVAQCKAFCSFDRHNSTHCCSISACVKHSLHFTSQLSFFGFLFSVYARLSLWLINRRLNAADCVKGSWHVISDGLSGPTSYKRCRQLSQQFSFQIFWSTDVK